MTIKQGEDINKEFANNQKKLDSLKDSIRVKRLLYDSLNFELNKIDKTKEEYKNKYEERLKMPIKYPYHDDGWDFAQKLVLVGVIVLQFFTIKR
jgi:predicted transcriptional regulator